MYKEQIADAKIAPILSNENWSSGAYAKKCFKLPGLRPGYAAYWICTVVFLWPCLWVPAWSIDFRLWWRWRKSKSPKYGLWGKCCLCCRGIFLRVVTRPKLEARLSLCSFMWQCHHALVEYVNQSAGCFSDCGPYTISPTTGLALNCNKLELLRCDYQLWNITLPLDVASRYMHSYTFWTWK